MTNNPHVNFAPAARRTSRIRGLGPIVVVGAVGLTAATILAQSAQAQAQTQTAQRSALPSSILERPERTIYVSGKAAVRVVPDRATITLGVVTRNDNVATAQQKNEGTVREVVAALLKSGVPRTGISPGTFVIDETVVDDSSSSVSSSKTTYGVTTQITVTLIDLKKVGDALRVAVDGGANRANVEFGTTALRQVRDQARASAIKAAREKGRDMAIAAGIELGPVRSFAEQGSSWGNRGTQNSVQNLDSRIATGADAAAIGNEVNLFGEGPILIEAEVSVEIAVK